MLKQSITKFMMKRKKNRTTKRPMLFTSFYLPEADAELMRSAAKRLGIAQSDLIRRALRRFAHDVLVNESIER